jgi:hypothetical protein
MLSVNLMLNIMINTWYLLISRDLSRASKLGLYFHSNGSLKGPYFVSKWVSIGSLFFSQRSLKLIGHPAKVKFSSYKSKPKLAICNVANQNIPPAVNLPSPPKPKIPKLSCVTLKSTCDTPECQKRHRPCFYTGMPKPWYDDC